MGAASFVVNTDALKHLFYIGNVSFSKSLKGFGDELRSLEQEDQCVPVTITQKHLHYVDFLERSEAEAAKSKNKSKKH